MTTFLSIIGTFFLDFLIGEVVDAIIEVTLSFATVCFTAIPKIGSVFIGAIA